MLKLSDYIFKFLAENGVTDVFMISGGGAMHLVDSVGKNPKIKYLCPHHEQAAAIAAEGYARIAEKPGVVVVTSGPGGTNTLTGVIGQWLDSVPVLYLSGQVKFETTIASCPEVGLRQLGDQEINIIDIVRPVTKYAEMVTDPKKIRWHLEKAWHLACEGRPGPVWLDIPLNIQAALIDEALLPSFQPREKGINKRDLSQKISQIIGLLKKAQRPILIAGNGIRIARAQADFLRLVEKLNLPVVSTFSGLDLIPTDHKLFIGRIGTVGDRAGNFALQNADLVLSVGSRNNIRQISYSWQTFARAAKKVIVDIDPAELNKPTVQPDLPVCVDAGIFFRELEAQTVKQPFTSPQNWSGWCGERKKRYPVVLAEYKETKDCVNPYYFTHTLTQLLGEGAIVFAGNGTACVTLFQASVVKNKQRMVWNSGCASMGYDLPAAIGACVANGKKDVVCLAGDGSLQMNIQELQTLATYNLPVKLFVLNNCGYVSIKQTQDSFFEGRRVACCPNSGVVCPDIVKVAAAYGLATKRINSPDRLKEEITEVLQSPGPIVCEVVLPAEHKFAPKLSSEKKPDGKMASKPLEDLSPFLDREEFKDNMLIPEWEAE